MAAALYGFLGWAFYTIWKEMRQQSELLKSRQVPSIQLDIPGNDGTIEAHPFNSPEVIIGRDSSCDLTLADETISARHARLNFHHNQWWLEDLQSTNGTFLNEEKLLTPTVLISGDEFRCGQISVLVSILSKRG